MQYIETCWAGCGDEFTVNAPDRSDPRLVDGVQTKCEHCGHPYSFSVDGDGEPSLESPDDADLGQNIGDEDSTHY